MYQAAIFDLDGTLLNTIDDLANAGNAVCQQNGWPTHTVEAYKRFVGNGIPKLVERFSPPDQRTPARMAQTLEQFRAYYAVHKEDCTLPYDGILPLLDALRKKGIPLGVLTNKEDRFAKEIVHRYFGTDAFCKIQGATEQFPPKPNPAALLHLCESEPFAGKRILFLGDSDVDIHTAANAKLDSCGVLWGFRGEAELTAAGATYLARHPSELAELF